MPKKKIHHENTSNPERCIVRLFQLFLSKRPENAERYYLQSKKDFQNSKTWYTIRPMGHNTLQKIIKNMTNSVGIPGQKTNHSLKTTCASRLYEKGIDEKSLWKGRGM